MSLSHQTNIKIIYIYLDINKYKYFHRYFHRMHSKNKVHWGLESRLCMFCTYIFSIAGLRALAASSSVERKSIISAHYTYYNYVMLGHWNGARRRSRLWAGHTGRAEMELGVDKRRRIEKKTEAKSRCCCVCVRTMWCAPSRHDLTCNWIRATASCFLIFVRFQSFGQCCGILTVTGSSHHVWHSFPEFLKIAKIVKLCVHVQQ